jgi:hypothetical protein
MRLSLSVATFLLLDQLLAIQGFSVVSAPTTRQRTPLIALSAEAELTDKEPRRKPLSPAEILKQTRAKQGLPEEEEEAPKLFSEPIYDDMQQILLTLENRVKGGPGSVSMLEVEELDSMSKRILVEMKQFEDDRTSDVTKSAEAPQEASLPPAAPAETFQEGEVLKSEEFVDPSDGEEGAVYDGTGGMGLAKGTGNTYVIPGMDSMSPEEYRAALQQSISDRQTVRKESGTYGNRATWNYLNNLTGETGVLKKDINEEEA